jgi:hypothetical protein
MRRLSLSLLTVLLMASAPAVGAETAAAIEKRQALARTTLQEALVHLDDIQAASDRNWAMQAVGLALAAAGDEANAREVDQKVETGEVPRPILRAIALAQFGKGHVDDAVATARGMKDQDGSDLTFMALAQQAESCGDPEMAAQLCQLATGPLRIEALLIEARIQHRAADEEGSDASLDAAKVLAVRQPQVALIAETEALLGNLERAGRLLGRIRRERERSNIYAAMAAVEAAAKDFENADADADSIYDDTAKSITLGRIAMARAGNGQIKQAVEGMTAISDDDTRLEFQRSLVAMELRRHGIAAGHDIAAAFTGDSAKAVCLSQVAAAAARAGKMTEAQSALDEANAALARPHPEMADAMLAGVADNLALMDKPQKAMELAGRILDTSRRSLTICQIVRTTTRRRDPADGQKLLESISDPRDRALARVGIAPGLLDARDGGD